MFVNGGLLTSFFYLAVFGLVFICVLFLYADIAVRTPEEHRFVGYSKLYLGKGGFSVSLFIGLLQLFFVLTIYLILAPSFFNLIFADNYLFYLIGFWLLGSAVIMLNIRRIAVFEFLITAGILAIIALIFIFGIGGFLNSPIKWGQVDISKFLAVGADIICIVWRAGSATT